MPMFFVAIENFNKSSTSTFMSADFDPNEIMRNFASGQRLQVPVNPLLEYQEPTMELTKLLALLQAAKASTGLVAERPRLFKNLESVSEEFIRSLYDIGGEEALMRFVILSSNSEQNEFAHFYTYLEDVVIFSDMFGKGGEGLLEADNDVLTSSPEIARFAHNVIDPVFSRKLFHPGVRTGYVVYGLTRPRILVSLPFKAGSAYTYDVFRNSLDVATSLGLRGYHGSFLMLDYLEGLTREIDGIPAWLIFFSLLATNSDAVLFVTEGDNGLTEAQLREAAFTPDRVPKKIVRLQDSELVWAQSDGLEDGLEVINFGPDGDVISKDEAMAAEASYALGLIERHERGHFPSDRLIVLRHDSILEIYPDGRRINRLVE
ncbi:hypothetical protein C3Y90_10270 [Rhizobium sp. UPM1134]|nr:hypothetical protein [Rhizobium ruizarguesonis]